MELRLLLALLWRRRRLMLLVFGLVAGGLTLLTLVCETQYAASAKVYLYHSSTKASLLSRVNLDSAMMGSASLTDAERATYEELATTVPVLGPLLDELHLTRKRKSLQVVEYIPLVRWAVDTWLPRLGRRPMTYEELTNKSIVHVLFPRPYIKAAMMDDADILEFSSSAESMELALALANAAARSFMAREADMRHGECRELAAAAAAELPRARDDYEKALAELGKLRQREKIVDLTSEGEKLVERYYSLTNDRDSNRLLLLKAQGMLANVKGQMAKRPEFRKSGESIQRSSLIDSLKLTLRDLYMDLAVAKSRMTAEHPQVKEIEGKIEEAKRLIKGEAQKVFGSETISTDPTFTFLNERAAEYTAQAAGLESQDAAYGSLLDALEGRIMAFPERAAAEALLKVRAAAGELFLSNLNQLHRAAVAGQALDLSIAHLVEAATPPGRLDDYMRPKLSLMLALGIVLGGFLALTAALLAAYLDPSLTPAGAVGLGAPVAGTLPRRPGLPRTQAVRRLRDALFPVSGRPPKVLVVADALPGPAQAMDVALELGAALARSGRSVALVDADLTRPSLHARLGLPLGPGLAEAVAGKVFRDAVILPGPESGLFALPAGQAALSPEAAEGLLDSPAVAGLLDGLGRRFDVVLVATAPAGASGDACSLSRHADAVLACLYPWVDDAAAAARATADLAAAAGRAPRLVLVGAPDDEPSPRDVWADLLGRLRRKRAAAPTA